MLFKNIFVDTFICLSCGKDFNADDVECGNVGDLKVPKSVKDNGKLFRMLICPDCKSPYLGFVPSQKSSVQHIQQQRVYAEQPSYGDVDEECGSSSEEFNSDDFANFKYKDRINEQDFQTEVQKNNSIVPKEQKKVHKQDIPTPKRSRPRKSTAKKIKCTSCKKEFEVGVGVGGTFGTKCPDCLKDLVKRRKS